MTTPSTDGAKPVGSQSANLVYVVDDEPMVGDVVRAMLRLAGYQCVYFGQPALAIDALAQATTKPVLLLTDFQMPSMNGRELIQQCKQIHPNLKTILYSGNAQDETAAIFAIKPDRFLRKPFAPKTLIDLVKALLQADRPT
jgi:CheY-like chemotaxis protein